MKGFHSPRDMRNTRNRICEIKKFDIWNLFSARPPLPRPPPHALGWAEERVWAPQCLSQSRSFRWNIMQTHFICFHSLGNILFSQGAANAKRNSPGTSSASSEGNDDAAMAVIMSLLEVTPSVTLNRYFHILYSCAASYFTQSIFRLTLVWGALWTSLVCPGHYPELGYRMTWPPTLWGLHV